MSEQDPDETDVSARSLTPLSGPPAISGSAGTQAATGTVDVVPAAAPTPLDSAHMGAVLGSHVAAGSPTTMAFAVAAFRDAHASREMLRDQLRKVSAERDEFQNAYHEESKRAAVLDATKSQLGAYNRLQSWVFGVGGVLAGVGIGGLYQADEWVWRHAIVSAVGFVLMWKGAPRSTEER